MKKLVVGILAHVDAGKTTLSESMLFLSGKIRRLGRVDNKDAYLDTFELEKNRGITIFSKQAVMNFGPLEMTLLDTPGHVDFSAEMERTLQVLDYAILLVSGADGVQGHTKTLWNLLKIYKVPTFIFVNKMDQNGTDKEGLMKEIRTLLDDACIPFGDGDEVARFDDLAMCDEVVMEAYLESSVIEDKIISRLIAERKSFPVYFGSALRQVGVDTLIEGMTRYVEFPNYPDTFGAKVFKITRDSQGNRLTHVKVTGGTLKVKDIIVSGDKEEKVNQIRIYSGEKFEAVSQIEAGAVCALTGLTTTRAGQGLGIQQVSQKPFLQPVLSYQLLLPEAIDERQLLPKLRGLEEEEPSLRIVWNEMLQVISVQIMGAVQIEILESLIMERFDVAVTFGDAEIVYKETIRSVVEGVGHFEPLRHYAEVHLLLEPGEKGSGLEFAINCSEDVLEKNWQRLVMTHLKEKDHIGVLTGAHITDMKISLVSGRGHNKHTVGGDFREATFRALRQGLKEAESVLLEPYYRFRIELPEAYVGRAMTDIDKMKGSCTIDQLKGAFTVITGRAPISKMRNYQQEISAYTKGYGKISVTVDGYDECHEAKKIVEAFAYDSERDVYNPTGSVFCSHGSGYLVPWDEVKNHMHIESYLKAKKEKNSSGVTERLTSSQEFISLEEIDAIINSTYYSNQGKKSDWKKRKSAKESHYDGVTYKGTSRVNTSGEEFLLVDGYNMIFDWPELKLLAKDHLGAARTKLMEILSNYQGIRKCHMMVVFDAYRVEGRGETVEDYHNIRVVYTGEAQTADQYIERFAHSNKKKYRIIVATSDGLQQIIIRGAGADLLSARELRLAVIDAEDQLSKEFLSKENRSQSKLEDIVSVKDKEQLKKL